MTALGHFPALTADPSIPSLRAKAPWPSRGNPSSRRKNEDAISVLDCFVAKVATFAPRNDGAKMLRRIISAHHKITAAKIF